MKDESQSEQGGVEQKITVAQLLQIKYLLAGILALAVIGPIGDWTANLTIIAVTFSVIYSIETLCVWIPATASRLASIHRRRKKALAESNRRMRKILKDLKQVEEQVQGGCE